MSMYQCTVKSIKKVQKINPKLNIVGTLYIDTLIFTNYARDYARNIPLRFFTVQSKFVGPPYYVL